METQHTKEEINDFEAVNIRKFFNECGMMNGTQEIFDKLKFLEILCLEQHKQLNTSLNRAAPDMLEALKSLVDPHHNEVWLELRKCLRAKDIKLIESVYKATTGQS